MDARQQRGDARVAVAVVLEVRNTDSPVKQRPRKHVLQAELGVECTLRSRPVGVLQPARMNPGIDPLDVLRLDTSPSDDLEHRVDGRMRAAAARILLDPDTGLDDVERRGPGTHGTLDVIGAWSVENLEEALLMLEHALRVCREAGLCQSRGQNAITSAVADVQRLRHGAEVRLDARGE